MQTAGPLPGGEGVPSKQKVGSAIDEAKRGIFGVGKRIETKFRIEAPLVKNFSVFYKSFMLALMFSLMVIFVFPWHTGTIILQ